MRVVTGSIAGSILDPTDLAAAVVIGSQAGFAAGMVGGLID